MSAHTAFLEQVRLALENFQDRVWLETNSPLATPYFLGELLQATNGAPPQRGRALQRALQQAAEFLWDGPAPEDRQALLEAVNQQRTLVGNTRSPRYQYLLLELRYFRRHFPARAEPRRVEDMYHFVGVGRGRFFDHLQEAIGEIARILIERFRPTLRLESPTTAVRLVGREAALTHAWAALQAGQSVALSGMSGIGKSSLGSALGRQWAQHNASVFWFTFRPGLNTQLESLLFALGQFLKEQGAPELWTYMLAQEGQAWQTHLALGFLRADLEQARPRRPLLCFDEVDLLDSGEAGVETGQPVLELLDSLRDLAPLLLMGQRAVVDTACHVALTGLPPAAIEQLFTLAGVELNAAELRLIAQRTHGNPRLLELLIALQASGEALAELVEQLPQAPALRPLLNRLEKHLSAEEKEILAQLAVFRSPAPADVWAGRPSLTRLLGRRLVQADGNGALTQLPTIRQLVYSTLSPEARETNHRQAAWIRAERSEYTAAAYHYWQAGDPVAAVRVWYPHRELEIRRGQAQAARHIFENISLRRLEGEAQRWLKLLRNTLALLEGEADRVLADFDAIPWPAESEESAEALIQRGQAQFMLGNGEAALDSYENAIATFARLSRRTMELRLRRSIIHVRQTGVSAARQEAQRAEYELAHLQGFVAGEAGDFPTALRHFQDALDLARQLQQENNIARTCTELTLLAGRLGDMPAARLYAEEAIVYYQRIGDSLHAEAVRANLAGLSMQVGDYAAVIEPLERALTFFERLRNEGWVASIRANLAESYLELGQLDKARAYAFSVLHMEEMATRPYACYTLGLVHERQGAPALAEATFQEGCALAQRNGDRFVLAYLQRALGQLYIRQGQSEAGRTRLEEAGQLFEAMHMLTEAQETRAWSADSLSG